MDVVKEDMAEVEVMEEDTEVRNNWRWNIPCGKTNRRRRRSFYSEELGVTDTSKHSTVLSCFCMFLFKSSYKLAA